MLMYYVYVGYLQMAHVAPEVIGGDARRRQQVELTFAALAAAELPNQAPAMRDNAAGAGP
jgi:hypothetical protein